MRGQQPEAGSHHRMRTDETVRAAQNEIPLGSPCILSILPLSFCARKTDTSIISENQPVQPMSLPAGASRSLTVRVRPPHSPILVGSWLTFLVRGLRPSCFRGVTGRLFPLRFGHSAPARFSALHLVLSLEGVAAVWTFHGCSSFGKFAHQSTFTSSPSSRATVSLSRL